MNRKAKGNRAEYRSMKILEQAGYSCTRSAREPLVTEL